MKAMTQRTSPTKRHFRGQPRPARCLEVQYRLLDQDPPEEQVAPTLNISVGGAFLLTPDPAPPGSKLTVTIQLPASPHHPARTVTIAGEVRWISDGEEDPVHGMGVRFSRLQADDIVELNDYFSSLTSSLNDDIDLG